MPYHPTIASTLFGSMVYIRGNITPLVVVTTTQEEISHDYGNIIENAWYIVKQKDVMTDKNELCIILNCFTHYSVYIMFRYTESSHFLVEIHDTIIIRHILIHTVQLMV